MSEPSVSVAEPTRPTAGGAPTWSAVAIVGALVVILSFFASYWGASLAGSSADKPVVVEEIAEPSAQPEAEAEVPVVLPAGADVRAGSGVPDASHGDEGDLFIDIDSADIFVRTASEWVHAGNIRTSAIDALTGERGETGEQGKPGVPGKAGEAGAAGSDGTQVVLGSGSPDVAENCGSDGDVFIDTVSVTFYECTAGSWTPTAP